MRKRVIGEHRFTRGDIEALAKEVHDEMYSIENTLKRRGYVYVGEGRIENVVLPKRERDIDTLYQHMDSRTFRNVLKKIVTQKRDIGQADLGAGCSATKLQEYIRFLESSGILNEQSPSSFSFALDMDDFGYTLEWYVAELFKRELACTAAWGVRVGDVGVGGDFDVLARVEAHLAYVETKTTVPEHISEREIRHFLQRDHDFEPDITIFLVDTGDNLSSLVGQFEKILTAAVGRGPHFEPHKDFSGIYHCVPRIFIVNSEPSILTSLRRCLNYYFAIVTHSTYFSPERPIDFLARH